MDENMGKESPTGVQDSAPFKHEESTPSPECILGKDFSINVMLSPIFEKEGHTEEINPDFEYLNSLIKEKKYFNYAEFKTSPNEKFTFFRAREKGAAPKEGELDWTRLIVATFIDDKVASMYELKPSVENGILSWEDPRVIEKDGKITVSITAVGKRDEKGDYPFYPAIFELERYGNQLFATEVPKTFHIFKEKGKNLTPIGNNEALYRKEGEDHILTRVKLSPNKEGEIELVELDKINFRDYILKWKNPYAYEPNKLTWMDRSIGTIDAPIELGDGKKLLFIHGTKVDQYQNCVYSIGFCILNEDWQLEYISEKPIFTPEDEDLRNKYEEFKANNEFGEIEGKKIVYSDCAHLEEFANKKFYEKEVFFCLNIGDQFSCDKWLKLSNIISSITNAKVRDSLQSRQYAMMV